MPIRNRDDAVEVESRIGRVFESPTGERGAAVRALFVEALDFAPASGSVDLGATAGNVALPPSAERIASLDGVHVVYVALDTQETDRVRKGEASAAAKRVTELLGEDLLLVFTNTSASQLHFVYPGFEGARPILRRMVVERDLPRRTAVQQVSNIYWNLREHDSIRLALDHAFDVEPVTKEFFAEYKRVFEAAESYVSGFGEDVETKRRFVQTLFNRLMFIYFLSRKGWLTFKGDKDYLNALWQDYGLNSEQANFYRDRLEHLFFFGLNNPQSRDLNFKGSYMASVFGDVPFLNGGLFEKTDLDSRDGLIVPDEAIRPILRDLFDRFNFTVLESTPFDVEVAVDPEMLGKVFEELVTGRHDSGAYYTPRPVVSFMCREALKGYLESQDAGVTPGAIARFVDERDTSGISVASARKVAQALDEVTAVDPACGSGAYLLGMMQELVELQTALFNVGVDPKGLYDLKMHVIQRNLYGVDIDDFAVNIAMLRLWLSLAIEYEGIVPPPLPNLDFKVLCGDSLLGPDPSAGIEAQGTLGQDMEQFQRLGRLKADYMRASLGPDKERLRQQIDRLTDKIRQALGVSAIVRAIDWRVEFAEVFAQRGGFDIAIANPPYGITIRDRRSTAIAQPDSYTNFMALATEIMPSGVMAYITPTSWETGEGFKKFRQFLFGRIALRSLVNLPYDVFDTPYVDTAITVGAVGKMPPKFFNLATFQKRRQLNLTQIADHLESISWSVVTSDANLRLPLLGWAANLFNRISAGTTTLGSIASSKRGIEAYRYKFLKHESPDAHPFFTGQLQRYEILPSPDKAFVVLSGRDNSYHQGARILTRRIVSRANRLMSAFTDKDYVVKKDLYSLKLRIEYPDRLTFLLGILNSSLMSFLYLSRSSSATKDDFRQVSLAGLRELPIRFPGEREDEIEFVRLVEMRERQLDQADALDHRIDQLVYRIYDVTDWEQRAIEEWLAQPG